MLKFGKVPLGLVIAGLAGILFWVLWPDVVSVCADRPPGRQVAKKRNPVSRHKDAAAMTSRAGGEGNREAVDLAEQVADEHRELPDAARSDLLSFVSAGKPEGMLDGEWQERVNVILNALRVQGAETGERVVGLTELLVEMAASDSDPILRMYAMQHLALWYPNVASADARREILELMHQIVTFPNERSVGGALQALSDIARSSPDAGREVNAAMKGESLDEIGLRIAGDGSLAPDVRISALQSGLDRGNRDVLDVMRRIATDAGENGTLRKAAIHGIGEFGGRDDLDLLELLPQEDENLALAVLPAIKRLSARWPGQGRAGSGGSKPVF